MADLHNQTLSGATRERSIDTVPAIQVQNVSRVYALGQTEVTALQNISLEVPKGVLAVLKGRSGSGKTTLLNMIGGLDSPTTGDVCIFGQSVSRMSQNQLTDIRRKQIGFIFQSFAIMPTFSALENVELMLRIAGFRGDRRETAMRSLDVVGLGAWAHHRPWELSGGQQQRVAIARALSDSPGHDLGRRTHRRVGQHHWTADHGSFPLYCD